MADQGRAKVGFADALDDAEFDGFAPIGQIPKPRPNRHETRQAAEAVGFRSREPVPPKATAPIVPNRRRTGRNDQIGIRTTTETKEKFKTLADAMGWSEAVAFEKAVELLEKNYGT